MIETPAVKLAPGLRCLRAPNPGPMTAEGTNTYLLGTRDLAVIDPGPDDPAHLEALMAALEPGQTIRHILVTHSHRDHSALVPALKAATGARVFGFGASDAGRTARMQALAATEDMGGGEGIDAGFTPDVTLASGTLIDGAGWTLRAHWTPGHMANHMCFEWLEGRALFTGDIIMGWASSLISPPDGDVGQFLESLARIEPLDIDVMHSGHGAPISEPAARVQALRAHRHDRLTAAYAALSDTPQDIDALMPLVYGDVPRAMWRIAARNLLAALIYLEETGKASSHPTPSMAAHFKRR